MDNLNIWVIIAQLINFGILFFVFKKFLADKITAEIEERRESISRIQSLDSQVESTMEDAKKEADKIIAEARTKGQDIVSDSEKIAKTKAEAIVAKAEGEASSKLDEALREIEKERLDMLGWMKSKLNDLVLKLNAKLFKNESANKDFLEKEVEAIKL